MSYQNIITSKDGNIGMITIHRPDSLNALNSQTMSELAQALTDFENDLSVRALIIVGQGEKAFVAGADIKEFKDMTSAQAEEYARKGQREVFDKIENMRMPVIAAINGFALGGGLELALACHIRYASENAKMGLPEVTLGLIPGYGGTQRLTKLVGKGWAFDLILSGQMLSAEKAKQIGLINDVYAQPELIYIVKEVASVIARNSSVAVANAIKAINQAGKPDGFETEIQSFGALFSSPDKTEGVQAFLEKRKPNFS